MSHQQSNPPSTSWLDVWHVSPSLNKDYDVIDGLRGIAILMVVASHILYHDPDGGTLERLIGGAIWAGGHGVTVFFALSGFLISLPFWKRKSQGNPQLTPPGYARRRFWKIYPPLALSLLLLAPIYVLKTGDASYLPIALKWLAGLPLVTPPEGKFNPVMWSLIVEVHFYASLPLLFFLTRKLDYKTTLITLFLVLLTVPCVFRWWGLSQGISSTIHPLINTRYPSSLDSFAFGVLIGGMESIRAIRRNWVICGNPGLILLVSGLCLSSINQFSGGGHSVIRQELLDVLFKLAAGLLILYIAKPHAVPARLFSSCWLRWLGIISYEWYLSHQPIFLWTRYVFGGSSGGDMFKYLFIIGISGIGSLLLAALVYRCFSLPILRWGRHGTKTANRQPDFRKAE